MSSNNKKEYLNSPYLTDMLPAWRPCLFLDVMWFILTRKKDIYTFCSVGEALKDTWMSLHLQISQEKSLLGSAMSAAALINRSCSVWNHSFCIVTFPAKRGIPLFTVSYVSDFLKWCISSNYKEIKRGLQVLLIYNHKLLREGFITTLMHYRLNTFHIHMMIRFIRRWYSHGGHFPRGGKFWSWDYVTLPCSRLEDV